MLVAGFSAWVAVQARRESARSAAAAEISAEQTKRANDLTVRYKDAVWTLEAETEPLHHHGGVLQTELRLTNRGDSPGFDVTIDFDFDPTHLHIDPVAWPFIDKGNHATFATKFGVAHFPGPNPWNSSVVEFASRNQATVKWTSQAGEPKVQRVTLPRYDHLLDDPKPAPEQSNA